METSCYVVPNDSQHEPKEMRFSSTNGRQALLQIDEPRDSFARARMWTVDLVTVPAGVVSDAC